MPSATSALRRRPQGSGPSKTCSTPRERLHREADRARTAVRAQREAFARRALQIQQTSTEMPGLEATVAATLQRRRRLSAFAYLRFLVTGRSAIPD